MAVVDRQKQSPDPLARSPADLLIPGFEVRIRPAEAQPGHPVVVEPGHLAEAASDQAGAVHRVRLLGQLVEAEAFAFFDQPDAHPTHAGLFRGR